MWRWASDLRLAGRMLRKRPGFSLTVVTTLALGIGATTALFGVFKTVFLEPLPLPESQELVAVMQSAGFGCCGPASAPDYGDWVERSRSFEGLALLSPRFFNLTGDGEAERVYAVHTTASAFGFLGVDPLMGRVLRPEDEEAPFVVVLGHGLWTRMLGQRADVLGTAVEINGVAHTVVGVMPEDFDLPSPWNATRRHQFYVPFHEEWLEGNRGNHSFPVIGRLAEGVSLEAAQEDMDRIMRELAAEYPDTNANRMARVFTIHEYLYGNVGRQMALILAAAALVLLVACGNVAGLQVARAAARETELAVRSAMGASRSALIRLLFSESVVLAALGGAVGIGVTVVLVDAIQSLLPPSIPRVDAIGIDAGVLLFAVAVAALTALLFGMVPALITSRGHVAAAVREGGYATLAPAKERLRDYFIVAQIALGLLLANGAALLVRSYVELRGEESGFESEGVLTLVLNASGPRYEDVASQVDLYDRVVERLDALPMVESVGVVSKLPLAGGTNGNVLVEGRGPRATNDEGPLVEVSSVSGDYFAAMGIPLLMGRTLTADDSIAGQVGGVINRAMAEEVWPGEDPLGKRFSFDDNPPNWATVVGVVGDVRQWSLERPPLAEAYYPYTRGWSSTGYIVARITGDLPAAVAEVRRTVLSVDPSQPPSGVLSMDERVEQAFAQRRFYTTLIALFAGAALLLAAAGIYGTVSYYVARRTRELGVRMALGASHTGILGLIVRRGFGLALRGVAIGLVGVWATTRVLDRLLYGVTAIDALTMIGGSVILASVAVAASFMPARRALRVPPVLALRSE